MKNKPTKKTKSVKKVKKTKKRSAGGGPASGGKKTKKVKSKKVVSSRSGEKPVGMVTHFYGGIKVAIVKFKKPIKAGTRLYFRGATTDFVQAVDSIQFDHQPISVAKPNKQVGIKVGKRVREGDEIFVDKS
jgi:hypothetical protein